MVWYARTDSLLSAMTTSNAGNDESTSEKLMRGSSSCLTTAPIPLSSPGLQGRQCLCEMAMHMSVVSCFPTCSTKVKAVARKQRSMVAWRLREERMKDIAVIDGDTACRVRAIGHYGGLELGMECG